MKLELTTLNDIPCTQCLIWEPLRQGPENCNPNHCQKLTDWLLTEAQKQVTVTAITKTTH